MPANTKGKLQFRIPFDKLCSQCEAIMRQRKADFWRLYRRDRARKLRSKGRGK